MEWLDAFTIIVIVVFLYYFAKWARDEYSREPVVGSKSHIKYYVVGDFDDKQQAVNILEEADRKLLKILEYMKMKYQINCVECKPADDFVGDENTGVPSEYADVEPAGASSVAVPYYARSDMDHLGQIVERIVEKYNNEELYENDPRTLGSGETTYTVRKGEKMLVCLRDTSHGNAVHDVDVVLFVMLHELSHIGNVRWGHSPESGFWEIFKFVLHEAALSGYYKPVDYQIHPVRYCGIDVNYNPYFSDATESIWKIPNWEPTRE